MSDAFPLRAEAVRALEENLWALWSRFGRGDGCTLHEDRDALWYDTPISTLPYNGVLRFTVDEDPDRRIDELFEHYRRRGVPSLWIVHPTARPADLAGRLRRRGLEQIEECAGMSADLAALPPPPSAPTGTRIAEVTGADAICDFLELVAWRWNIPAGAAAALPAVMRAFELGVAGSVVRVWLAWRSGVAVAKVGLHLAAGAAGLYGVATRPEARGQGLARTLTLHAFASARAAGYRLGVLHATPMARSLYEKLGFRSQACFGIFAPPHSLHL
jgi:GNAT superfamily N-acetyltransferase